MQTAGTGLTINGSNNNNTVSATVATVATPGITITTNFTTNYNNDPSFDEPDSCFCLSEQARGY